MVQFAFAFHGFATYNVRINPSDPGARSVLTTMIDTGEYFFFALDSDHQATAFRSDIGTANLAGLKASLSRMQRSATTMRSTPGDIAVRAASRSAGHFAEVGVSGQQADLDPAQDPLVMNPG